MSHVALKYLRKWLVSSDGGNRSVHFRECVKELWSFVDEIILTSCCHSSALRHTSTLDVNLSVTHGKLHTDAGEMRRATGDVTADDSKLDPVSGVLRLRCWWTGAAHQHMLRYTSNWRTIIEQDTLKRWDMTSLYWQQNMFTIWLNLELYCEVKQNVEIRNLQLQSTCTNLSVYLAGAEKSPQRSELGFDGTTVFELLLSSSNRHPDTETQR